MDPLLAIDPFPGSPPTFIRARLYRYTFTQPADHPDAWWSRELEGDYLPPLSIDSPGLVEYLESVGLL
jgi:hypothetical protein